MLFSMVVATCISIDMTLKRPIMNMHNGSTNLKVHVYSDKQIHVNMDTIVSFVI